MTSPLPSPQSQDSDLKGGYELSVIAPAFNERDNVAPLIARLDSALTAIRWQIIYVDDDSPDGTAETVKTLALKDSRVSCLRRVGRRGLAGAIVEGALASAAPYVAVIDADLQHDETLLPAMLDILRQGETDLVIASRYVGEGAADAGFSQTRALGSRLATRLARMVLRTEVTDPVSGFFMVRREVIDRAALRLSTHGFKLLFDLIASQRGAVRIRELPYRFQPRTAGESKMDSRVVIDYLGLIAARASQNLISPRLFLYGLVGLSGVCVHMAVFSLLTTHVSFSIAQLGAAAVAMTTNFFINNAVTFRDRRRRGLGLLVGYVQFCGLCSIGFLANLAIANQVQQLIGAGLLAGAAGALVGAAWNYVTTALAVW